MSKTISRSFACRWRIPGYDLPTDFARPTNIAFDLIEFQSLDAHERYRQALANDAVHRSKVSDLVASGAVLDVDHSLRRRHAGVRPG